MNDRVTPEEEYKKKQPSNTIGMIANIGVEYFLCKAISMSAFLDLGLTHTTSNIKFHDSENDYSYVKSKQTKFITGKMGGNFAINFYF